MDKDKIERVSTYLYGDGWTAAVIPLHDFEVAEDAARTMSAAYDMLKALEGMVKAFDGQTEKASVWNNAKNAIAKAKGI